MSTPTFPNIDIVEQRINGNYSNIQPAANPQSFVPPVHEQPSAAAAIQVTLTDEQFHRLFTCQTADTASQTAESAPASQPQSSTATNVFNTVDKIGDITLGTVNRAGKLVLNLAEGIMDLITLGYGTNAEKSL